MPWFRKFKRTTIKRISKRGLGKTHDHKNRKKGVKKNKSIKKSAGN